MDLLAALALVAVIEGLALVVFARSLPELLAEIDTIEPETLRKLGLGLLIAGCVGYWLIRSGSAGTG